MGGVYGEFLGYFSELMEQFKIYKYTTLRDSGYKTEYSRTITAVRQARKINVDEYRYKQLPIMDIEKSYYLWTSEKLSLEDEFVEIDGEMYRLMETSTFNREGGFWETRVNKIVGNVSGEDNEDIVDGEF